MGVGIRTIRMYVRRSILAHSNSAIYVLYKHVRQQRSGGHFQESLNVENNSIFSAKQKPFY